MHEGSLQYGPVGFECIQLPMLFDELSGMHLVEPICTQDIGGVITETHRCIAFPNINRRQIQPFHLGDPTKPGHRKILVFFLIDQVQRVPSATDVAPQQREWVAEAMQSAGANSALARLPVETLAMISEESDGTMSRPEAEEYRGVDVREGRARRGEQSRLLWDGSYPHLCCVGQVTNPALMVVQESICGGFPTWSRSEAFS